MINWRSPITRLTGWYTLIIMLLSISFSIALYYVMAPQVSEGLRRQAVIFHERWPGGPGSFVMNEDLIRAQLIDIRTRIKTTLVLLNGVILIVAGSASYLLAKRTLKPIEENLESQRRFTADASHELRTPLTAMRTEIEVALRSKESNPAEYERIMHSSLEEIQRLENLSHGLLRLAQHEADQPIAKVPVSVSGIIDQAVKNLSVPAQAKHIQIDKADLNETVSGEPQSLAELFTILLDNAVKYSPDRTTVSLNARHSNRSVVVGITDQGVGIRSTDLPHIFERFYRADTSRFKLKADGYGLGLPIAKQIADQHNGLIEVKSNPGKGTTVNVTLPRAD